MSKQSYKINPILQFLVNIWMLIYVKKYRVTTDITPEVSQLNEPYLLLSNHVGRFDPFILYHHLAKAPHFISSDAILRDRVIGTIFKLLGALPIKKGTRDSQIIREMAKVIQSGNALALFPEGARTWTGQTGYFDPSIVKLVRLLKVPVITTVIRGVYMSDPRWGNGMRKSAMHIEYKLAFRPEDVKALTDEQIYETIKRNLQHDDVAYQRDRLIRLDSEKRAEFIEFICFQCPSCQSFDGFDSKGNDFTCRNCSSTNHVDEFGFLTNQEGNALEIDNTRDWVNWQNKNFARYIQREIKQNNSGKLFSSKKMHLEFAVGYEKMQSLGEGMLHFYSDRIEVVGAEKTEVLPISEISALTAQFKERIELFYQDKAYRFTSVAAKESGMKWEVAINTTWLEKDQSIKISPSFKELIEAIKA